jgi:hypothetical protein
MMMIYLCVELELDTLIGLIDKDVQTYKLSFMLVELIGKKNNKMYQGRPNKTQSVA